MRTKICGITSFEDAMVAIEAGADALGFVFYEKSPRYVTTNQAKEIIKKLPPFVEKVALFVNEEAKNINFTCKEVGATLAQIHFEASDEFYNALEVPHIKVIRALKKEDIEFDSKTWSTEIIRAKQEWNEKKRKAKLKSKI